MIERRAILRTGENGVGISWRNIINVIRIEKKMNFEYLLKTSEEMIDYYIDAEGNFTSNFSTTKM